MKYRVADLTVDQPFTDSNPIAIPASTLSQPIPIDTNGDMKIDLLGITPQSARSNSPVQIWQNAWNASQPNSPVFNMYVLFADPTHFDLRILTAWTRALTDRSVHWLTRIAMPWSISTEIA
jgi:hypothetical protein